MSRIYSLRKLVACFWLGVCALSAAQSPVPQAGDRTRVRMLQQTLPEGPTLGFGFKLHKAEGGLPDCMEIVLVQPGSTAERAGLLIGDLVLSVNGKSVPTTTEFMLALHPAVQGTVTLDIRQNGRPIKVLLPVTAATQSGSSVDPFSVPGLAKAATPADRKRLEGALRLVQHLKESYELKDFSAWASYEDYSREEIFEGAKMVAELTGLDEWIHNRFVKKWGLDRALAFYEAGQEVIDSAYEMSPPKSSPGAAWANSTATAPPS